MVSCHFPLVCQKQSISTIGKPSPAGARCLSSRPRPRKQSGHHETYGMCVCVCVSGKVVVCPPLTVLVLPDGVCPHPQRSYQRNQLLHTCSFWLLHHGRNFRNQSSTSCNLLISPSLFGPRLVSVRCAPSGLNVTEHPSSFRLATELIWLTTSITSKLTFNRSPSCQVRGVLAIVFHLAT